MQGKKIVSRIIALTLSAVMTFSTIGGNFTELSKVWAKESSVSHVNDHLKLWYTTPANIHTAETSGGDWMQQSLPLGNGNLGNLIFGGVTKERIHFNEKTLWTGGPSSSRPNYQFGNKSTAYTAEEIEAEYNKTVEGSGMKIEDVKKYMPEEDVKELLVGTEANPGVLTKVENIIKSS